jgi:cytochrome c-type protein NapC
MREGKSCLYCHEGEEKVIGDLIVSGEKLEPNPIESMPGFVEMAVTAEYDDSNLYLTFAWDAPAEGTTWGDEEDDVHLTVALGSNDLNVAPIAGCWAACHSDLPGMPDAAADSDLKKYLPGSRNKMTASGGGTDIRSDAELEAQLAEGKYLEFWQALLDGGELVAARDGYFLESRNLNDDSAVSATANYEGGRWTVEMVRPLTASGSARHRLEEGVEYTVGIALHENHASGRRHYTSFPMRLVLGAGEAQLTAARK